MLIVCSHGTQTAKRTCFSSLQGTLQHLYQLGFSILLNNTLTFSWGSWVFEPATFWLTLWLLDVLLLFNPSILLQPQTASLFTHHLTSSFAPITVNRQLILPFYSCGCAVCNRYQMGYEQNVVIWPNFQSRGKPTKLMTFLKWDRSPVLVNMQILTRCCCCCCCCTNIHLTVHVDVGKSCRDFYGLKDFRIFFKSVTCPHAHESICKKSCWLL